MHWWSLDKDSIQINNLKELDKNSFVTVVYNRYGKKLYSYAIKSWNLNEDTSWDLIYKTIYKLADSYINYTFESEEKFASFIFKIFINHLRNHYKSNKAAKAFEFTAMDDVAICWKRGPFVPHKVECNRSTAVFVDLPDTVIL